MAVLKRLVQLAVLALVTTGCASLTLTSAQQRGLEESATFIHQAARAYGHAAPPVHVARNGNGVAARYERGQFYVSPSTTTQWWRDALLAHEVGHWLLGHDAPLVGVSDAEREARQYQREIAAHVKAVEILMAVKHLSTREALTFMHRYLMSVESFQNAQVNYVAPWGHRRGCREAEDLLTAFPAHRTWAFVLTCSPWATAGQ